MASASTRCHLCDGPNHGDPNLHPCNTAAFSDLLQEERHRYQSARPPFVLNNRCRPLPTSRTFLIQDDENVPNTPIEVKVEDWSERDFYCTAVIGGRRKLLKRVSDRAGHHVFGEWDDYSQSAWPTVAYSASSASSTASSTSGVPSEMSTPGEHTGPPSRDYATPPSSGRSSPEEKYHPPTVDSIKSRDASPPHQEASSGGLTGSSSSKGSSATEHHPPTVDSVKSRDASPPHQEASSGGLTGSSSPKSSSAIDYHPPTIRSIPSRDPSPFQQQASSKLSSSLSAISLSSVHCGSSSSLRTLTDRDDLEYWLQRKRENADERRVFVRLKMEQRKINRKIRRRQARLPRASSD